MTIVSSLITIIHTQEVQNHNKYIQRKDIDKKYYTLMIVNFESKYKNALH